MDSSLRGSDAIDTAVVVATAVISAEAWRDMEADPVLGPIWYECACAAMCEAYLPRTPGSNGNASGFEATTPTRSASSAGSRARRSDATPVHRPRYFVSIRLQRSRHDRYSAGRRP